MRYLVCYLPDFLLLGERDILVESKKQARCFTSPKKARVALHNFTMKSKLSPDARAALRVVSEKELEVMKIMEQ